MNPTENDLKQVLELAEDTGQFKITVEPSSMDDEFIAKFHSENLGEYSLTFEYDDGWRLWLYEDTYVDFDGASLWRWLFLTADTNYNRSIAEQKTISNNLHILLNEKDSEVNDYWKTAEKEIARAEKEKKLREKAEAKVKELETWVFLNRTCSQCSKMVGGSEQTVLCGACVRRIEAKIEKAEAEIIECDKEIARLKKYGLDKAVELVDAEAKVKELTEQLKVQIESAELVPRYLEMEAKLKRVREWMKNTVSKRNFLSSTETGAWMELKEILLGGEK